MGILLVGPSLQPVVSFVSASNVLSHKLNKIVGVNHRTLATGYIDKQPRCFPIQDLFQQLPSNLFCGYCLIMEFFQPSYRSLKSLAESLQSIKHWHALRTHALEQLGWMDSRKARKSLDYNGAVPWLPYSCTQFLDQTVSVQSRVLEIGGGSSTVWWLSRGNSVTTVETEASWAEEIERQCRQRALKCDVVITGDKQIPETVTRLDETFDVIVNDGHGDRISIVEALLEKLSPNGIFVWDNSDRVGVSDSLRYLENKGFRVLNFFGIGPINAYCSQTSVLSRQPIEVEGRGIDFRVIEY